MRPSNSLFSLILLTFGIYMFLGARAPETNTSDQLVWKADSTSIFEVGTQVRAWTIKDEGMSAILDNMQSMAGINNVYMVVVMHQ